MSYSFIDIEAPGATGLPVLRDFGAEIEAMPSLIGWFSAEPDFMTAVDDSGTSRCSALADRAPTSPGTLTQATMGKRPAILTNRLNGRGSLLFTRTRLDSLVWSKTMPIGTNPFTEVHIFIPNQTAATSGCIWGFLQSAAYIGQQNFQVTNGGVARLGIGADVQASTATAIGNSIPRAAIASWDPVAQAGKLLVNGFDLATDNTTGGTTQVRTTNSENAVRLGNSYDEGAGGAYNGEWVESLIFNVDLFNASYADELQVVEDYIFAQFGLTL